MLAYLACALAAIRLLPGDVPLKIAAAIATAFVVWMVYGLGLKADLWGLVLLLLGLPVYWLVKRERVTATVAHMIPRVFRGHHAALIEATAPLLRVTCIIRPPC